jgi:hypothetical protein
MRQAFGIFVLSVALLLQSQPSRAEIYRGIGPLHTLANVKELLPGAKFERLQPAWAQAEDAMYSITGRGISGTIIVKFYDNRPYFRQEGQRETDATLKQFDEKLAAQSDEEALRVEWVRWVPDEPIPLQRFISKYGKPDKQGFSDENMEPYMTWTTKGIMVVLSDNEKAVLKVDYEFTKDERRQAYKAKYGVVPDFLK